MAHSDTDIRTLLDIANWEPLQNALAAAFGIAVTVVDYRGSSVTPFSGCTEFCAALRTNTAARRYCCRAAALAGLEAVRLGEPFIYKCGCGIMCAAVPLMVNEKFLGSVILGQVRPAESAQAFSSEWLHELLDPLSAGHDMQIDAELSEKYLSVPELSYEEMLRIGTLFSAIVRYIVNRTVNSRNRTQTYEWMLRYAVPSILGDSAVPIKEFRPSALEALKTAENLPVSPESTLYPAVNYVVTHRELMIGMREMAELCHLSPSYFSKLFLREVGENFTDWVNRQKTEWAKEMLRDSSKSIAAIAAELGFLDTSYFIKVFKKFENTTPLVYRQHKM